MTLFPYTTLFRSRSECNIIFTRKASSNFHKKRRSNNSKLNPPFFFLFEGYPQEDNDNNFFSTTISIIDSSLGWPIVLHILVFLWAHYCIVYIRWRIISPIRTCIIIRFMLKKKIHTHTQLVYQINNFFNTAIIISYLVFDSSEIGRNLI